ncbi:MAG: hypothetical protein LBU89_14840, partial [Fibromonadaceae bacterium]|nr:hypothetical protein [Fibromonadaceae bacterium]
FNHEFDYSIIVKEDGDISDDEIAEAFRITHANILSKTVAIADKAAVNAALTAYNALNTAVRALLTAEKTLLDNLLVKIGELEAEAEAAANQLAANTFKSTHATVLSKTVETVATSDKAALTAYNVLNTAVQALLDELLAEISKATPIIAKPHTLLR